MKAKSTNKLVSLALALFMLLMSIPFSMLATDVRAEETSEAAGAGKYVLNADTLTAVAEKTKADGETQKAGTNDYFTLYFSEKTKIDSNEKTFDDVGKITQRINFAGKMDVKAKKNMIGFTTSSAAEVKIWWSSAGDKRPMAILDEVQPSLQLLKQDWQAERFPLTH